MEERNGEGESGACNQNNDPENSCILVESDPSVILIDDSVILEDDKTSQDEDGLPSHYEVIDQTFGSSQESCSQIEEVKL
jgi:hypothetical protein